jgi:hypothetical protein
MYGMTYYGGMTFAGAEAPPVSVTAELLLTFRTSPPTPAWEPIPLSSDVELIATFLDEGEPAEPTIVTCELQTPTGSIETPSMSRVDEGEWRALLQAQIPGRWTCRMQSSGNVIAVREGVFWVANNN